MPAVIGALRAELAAKIGEFVSDMGKAADSVGKFKKRFEGHAKSLQRAGAIMSAAVTAPFTALVSSSIGDFKAQEDALAKVDAALSSTGGAAKLTRQELEELAGALQKATKFADEDILANATGSLLKFTNVAGETFKRAQTLTLDVATAMKTELAPAAELVGKALNDPARGFKALRSLGITFTSEQQKIIKSLADTGQMAEAQGLILDEIAKRFGGQAAAAANTTSGSLQKLTNQWGEVKEKIGEIAVKVLPPLIEKLGELVDWLNEMDPSNFEALVVAAAALAAGGPILLGLGSFVSLLAKIPAAVTAIAGAAKLLGAGLALLGGPVTIAIGAIALLAGAWILYGDQIKAKLAELNQSIDTALNGPALRAKVAEAEAAIGGFANSIGAKIDAGLAVVREKFTAFLTFLRDFAAAVVKIIADMVTEVTTWLTTKLLAAFDQVKAKIDAVSGWFKQLYVDVVGGSFVPDMIDGIAAEFGRLGQVMVKPAKDAADATANAIAHIVDAFEGLFDKLWEDGKLTFDDLAKAAKDLAKQLFIQPAFDALRSGLSGWLQNSNFAGFFADGGTIPAGQWGIAGEEGPEPIIAGRRPLTVTPHDEAGGGRGGVTQIFNIQTPDADSFRRSQRQIGRQARAAIG